MGDSDGEEAPNLGALRRDREVLTNKIMKVRDKMYKELEETPAELDVILARDTEAAVEALLNEGHSIKDRLISVEADPAKLDEDDGLAMASIADSKFLSRSLRSGSELPPCVQSLSV